MPSSHRALNLIGSGVCTGPPRGWLPARTAEHDNPGEATLQVLGGRVRLVADATEWEGRDGDHLIVPQARHTLPAVEDSAVLLTVANFRRRRATLVVQVCRSRTRSARLVTPVDGGARAGSSLLTHAAPLWSLGRSRGRRGLVLIGGSRRCRCSWRMCQSSSLRLRNSRPQVTHFSAMGDLHFVVVPDLHVLEGPSVPRSMLGRWAERSGAVAEGCWWLAGPLSQ
jgi:hypothetical protein